MIPLVDFKEARPDVQRGFLRRCFYGEGVQGFGHGHVVLHHVFQLGLVILVGKEFFFRTAQAQGGIAVPEIGIGCGDVVHNVLI